MYDFEFLRPSTIEEAVAALADEDAQALGGGQTLIPTMKQRLAAPATLVCLTGITDLLGVTRVGSSLIIGAATTHSIVARDARDDFPGLADLAGQIGDPAVRNRGTLGGSLANNDPSACYPAAALGTGASIKTNSREILAEDFFDGMFGTALEDGEIIVSVSFPIPKASAYVKMHQPASRFAMVGAFIARYEDGVRVAITGASEEGVFRWAAAEEVLNANFTAAAMKDLSADPSGMISDIHAGQDYRAHLVNVMTTRAVRSIE